MPQLIVSVALQGDMPTDARPVAEVAKALGVSVPYLRSLLGKQIPGWIYLQRYYYCRLEDARRILQGRSLD